MHVVVASWAQQHPFAAVVQCPDAAPECRADTDGVEMRGEVGQFGLC